MPLPAARLSPFALDMISSGARLASASPVRSEAPSLSIRFRLLLLTSEGSVLSTYTVIPRGF